MNYTIPANTKEYLSALLEQKIQNNANECLFDNMVGYREKFMNEQLAPPIETPEEKKRKEEEAKLKADMAKSTGGFAGGFGGGGAGTGKKLKKGEVGNILFGDEPEAAALGGLAAYGVGSLPGFLGSLTRSGMGPKSFKSLLAGPLGPMVSKLGGQIEDISGKSWLDAQIGNIGRSQMKLAAQGAGSPWTPFVLPGEKRTEPYKEEDPYETLSRKIARKKIALQAIKLGVKP
jgi:hypothetical protein